MKTNFKHHAQAEALANALRELDTKQQEVTTLAEQIKQKYLVPKGVRLLIPLLEDWSNEELERVVKAVREIQNERVIRNDRIAAEYVATEKLAKQIKVCLRLGTTPNALRATLGIPRSTTNALIMKLKD